MAIHFQTPQVLTRKRIYRTGLSVSSLSAFLITQLPGSPSILRWGGFIFLPVALWCWLSLHRLARAARAREVIAARLTRLPGEFTVLHDLTIPAPWGSAHLDHLILSRFGIIVANDGATGGWMSERVEAVRSLLFARGLLRPAFPIRALILLPPGVDESRVTPIDAPVLRVERLTLEHLAPASEPALTGSQVESIRQCLLSLRQVA